MQLTKTQEGILNAEAVAGGAISNICGATFLPGRHSEVELNKVINTVIRINDAFRLHFDAERKEQWLEDFEWHDYEVLRFDERSSFEAFAREYARTPLETSNALFDAKIFYIGDSPGLIYSLHHAICDAWSLSVLRWQLHRLIEDGEVPQAFSFIEHIEEEQKYFCSKRFGRDRAYFIDQFHDIKGDFAAPDFQIRSFQSSSQSIDVPAAITKSITDYSGKTGVSIYVLLLAAFGICYSKYNDDAGCFYIGTTILNRTTEKDQRTIGPFINDIPLLFNIEGSRSAGEAVRQVEERVMDSFRHHRFNYPMMQEEIREETDDVRLYDVIFNYQTEFEMLDDYQVAWYQNGVQYEPLQIHIDHRNDSSRLTITYNYHTDAFTDSDISGIHKHFMNVISAITFDDSCPVSDISIMDEAELAEIMNASCGPERDLPYRSMYEIIETQQRGRIIDGDLEYSIDDLRNDAVKIDAAVRGDKRVIALICDRSYHELAAIYGIIRGGNAYLPLAADYPAERISTLLDASGCDTVLVQEKYAGLVREPLIIEDILCRGIPENVQSAAAQADDTLYVIFTSGSTGTPKGAMVSNRSAVNRVVWMAGKYFTEDSVVMRKTPYTFDVSVWELFGFAAAGATLYILPPEDHYRQDRIADHIRKGGVTDLHFVPTLFRKFLAQQGDSGQDLHSLKNIFLSGEVLPASLVNEAPAPVHNLYGPTECAVDVTYYDCKNNETDPVPIGRPVENCSVYILNRNMKIVPNGVKGQICIGGLPVGKGYINDPKKTSAVFADDPFGEGKLYLTGDTGWRNDAGEIVFTGRNDRQTKINGQRIEPEEIESALLKTVDEAAVIVEDGAIIAFYTGEVRPSLREALTRTLPRHMIPHRFIHVNELPLTPSGKVDRKALVVTDLDEPEYAHPENELEEQICEVFSKVLRKDKVGRKDNFYNLGGTSLDMLDILCTDPLSRLSPSEFMMDPTPEKLAVALAGEKSDTPLKMLYAPEGGYDLGIVLFPFAGGDASAYTQLVREFRNRHAPAALYYVPWGSDTDIVEAYIRQLAGDIDLVFYSHCAGAVSAMKLIDRLNDRGETVKKYIAAAIIPPRFTPDPWKAVTDKKLISILYDAGMPQLTAEQEKDVIDQFRSNTGEFFDYMRVHRYRTPCDVSLILSTNDLFTKNYKTAKALWEPHVRSVGLVKLIDSPTHYFQSADAAMIADVILQEAKECSRTSQ